jgi:hypothetical protein
MFPVLGNNDPRSHTLPICYENRETDRQTRTSPIFFAHARVWNRLRPENEKHSLGGGGGGF